MPTDGVPLLAHGMFFKFICFLTCQCVLGMEVLDQDYWRKSALEDLKDSLSIKYNKRPARNVILFIGDGMGPNTATAARIYRGGETSYLAWEKFPHVGAVKAYSADKQGTDSSATATAMLTGVKVNYETIGVDSTVKKFDCEASIRKKNRLVNVATLAQQEGKATGLVTTARITHATPAAMYAHSAYRGWECDTTMPNNASRCKDIARQLVEDEPGKNFNVIMGGGRQQLRTNTRSTPQDPVIRAPGSCVRGDGRDLIAEWTRGRELHGGRYALPRDAKELRRLDTNKTDYVLGIFQNNHFPYSYLKNTSANGVPSLEEMATTAIKILKNNNRGFLLLVENALIDQALHDRKTEIALSEIVELSKAVDATMRLLGSLGMKDDTLVIVTSDQSHALPISGYPGVGSEESGSAGSSSIVDTQLTTLSPSKDHPEMETTTEQQSAGKLMQSFRGGSDVFVYASGPYSHLFHNMHEQSYVAEVINYAARFGEFSQQRARKSHSKCSKNVASVMTLVIALIFVIKR